VTQLDRYSCEETFRRLDEYLDRQLSAAEERMVRAHLEACASCAAEFVFEASVIRAVREKVSRIAVPSGLAQRISAMIRRAAREGPPAA
jgi:anti-sigma factor (TIGR02949 family)